MYKTKLYIMSNDAKWMEKEMDLSFIPFPGMSLEGLPDMDDQPVRVNTISYDVNNDYFKVRLAWLSPDPVESKNMPFWKIRT